MMPPLISANRRLLSQVAPGFPNVGSGLLGTFRPMLILKKTTTIVSGQAQQVLREINSSGVIQPMTEDLDLKVEGDRSWEWWKMYAVPALDLQTDDVIEIAGTTYKVMRRWVWKHYGYQKIALITGFQA